jgi:enamine deaminase RidA (YjgF/YER057c/UK114 family)
LTDIQAFSGSESVATGPAWGPPDGRKGEDILSGSLSSSQELFGLHIRAAGPAQAFLVASPRWDAEATRAALAAYKALAQVLQDQGLIIVHERLFGSLSVRPEILACRAEVFSACGIDPDGPLTYIQGQPPWGEGWAGVIIRAVARSGAGHEVWTVRDKGKPMGHGWRQGGSTFVLLQNLQGLVLGGNGLNSRPAQVSRLLHKAAGLLAGQGASYRDVVRTWFYLDDILAWYPEFNRARTDIYGQFGLLPGQDNGRGQLPASTGIQGQAPSGAAATLDLLAVVGPPGSQPLVRQMRSPAQPEALTYGSAFSRGALIRHPEVSLIQVSGTAAIDEQGASLYPGDVRSQIDCTFDKIAALLGQEGAGLTDTAAACVFVKRPEDALAYQERAAARGLTNLPAIVMVADICREELLIEIDAEVAFNPVNRAGGLALV